MHSRMKQFAYDMESPQSKWLVILNVCVHACVCVCVSYALVLFNI